ncbi:MAG: outer membrane beta-barrel protein [Rhizobiales bacterium]|nr:outer membrane beta-barrel protein [Hyphomicrobiales bacterium]
MKKVLLTGVALAALACGPALAADLPARMPVKAPPPAPVSYGYNWSGFYLGGHAGGAFGEKCFSDAFGDLGCHDHDGFAGGGQLGFNVQNNQFVFGVEFSGSWADLTGSHNDPFGVGFSDSLHSDIDTILLFTGRVGLAFDRALLYVTGGGAWVRNEFRYNDGFGFESSHSKNRTGWTVGAGLEYGLAPNWSIAVQYNYIDLGEKDVSFTTPNVAFTAQTESHVHLATARINYRFGGWGGPPIAARY